MTKKKIPGNATSVTHVSKGGIETKIFIDASGNPMKTTTEPSEFREIILSELIRHNDELLGMNQMFDEIDQVIPKHTSNRAEFVAARKQLLNIRSESDKRCREGWEDA